MLLHLASSGALGRCYTILHNKILHKNPLEQYLLLKSTNPVWLNRLIHRLRVADARVAQRLPCLLYTSQPLLALAPKSFEIFKNC